MAWLGVTLGSMAILMLRHLTKGAWGMVIRRILGAAMRCVPLMAALFIPLLFGIRRLYIWARPLDGIADKHLREHLQEITKTLSLGERIHHSRRDLFRHLVGAVFLPDQVVGGAGPSAHARQQRTLQGAQRTGADPLRLHHHLRRHRLGHVHRSQLDFHHLRPVIPDRAGAVGAVLSPWWWSGSCSATSRCRNC